MSEEPPFQEVASTTSEIIVRNELEKYIADLEFAIEDLDSKKTHNIDVL